MLDRIALHQTRLRTPGLGLDAKGVALGAKGLVLLPSLDRLVAWLSVYTRDRSLEDLLPSLEIHLVRSKLGTREVALELAAESSDRMDRVADVARLVGGFTFTGTSRHFVQYRDAAAPFGYDAPDLLTTDARLALYHERFTQLYEVERAIDPKALLLRLMPHVDPATANEAGSRWIVAEQGIGPALVHYFVRSRVDGEVTVAEWPPASAFEDEPVRRYILRVPDLPARMHALVRGTPGITAFLPAGPGVAVQIGYRHPVSLRACPVFDPNGLILLRGGGAEPWSLPRVPPLGDLRAFAHVELRSDDSPVLAVATGTSRPPEIRVALRLMPSPAAWRGVTASWLAREQLPLLRRLAYALPRSTIARTTIAVTESGAFLRSPGGIEAVPLGTFFVEIHPTLFIPAGYEIVPAVASDVLHRALGSPAGKVLFLVAEGMAASEARRGLHQTVRTVGVSEEAFVPLETAILEAPAWEPAVALEIERTLDDAAIELEPGPLGTFPLAGVDPPADGPPALPAARSTPGEQG
jgi:hypothetical protein